MRVLVVVAGMTLGLSGCIGGGIVHRSPADGNETAEQGDPTGVDQAPWQLKEPGDDGAAAGKGSADSEGRRKTDARDDAGKDDGDPDPGDEDPEDQTNGTDGDDGNELDPVTGLAPTEGAASADDVVAGAEDSLPDQGGTSVPKQPAEEVGDAADDADPEKAAGSVDAEKTTNTAGGGSYIPSTDPLLLA